MLHGHAACEPGTMQGIDKTYLAPGELEGLSDMAGV